MERRLIAVPWGDVELEPEVRAWLESLSAREFAAAASRFARALDAELSIRVTPRHDVA